MKIILAFILLFSSGWQMPQPNPCALPSHSHDLSDYRIMLVKVEKLTDCGFLYSDLEQQTYCLDEIHLDDSAGDLQPLGSPLALETKIYKAKMMKAPVKVGQVGICIYCSVCRFGFILKNRQNIKES